jgi:Spy/CpxP family protein refolding chaperone
VKRWQALVALAGLFVLGVVSGGLGAHLYYARALDRPPGPPPFFAGFMGARLERHLDLTPEQGARMRQILDQSRREAEALRRDLAPRMRDVMERSEQRIRELLTAEQRQRFEELRRRHRRRSDRFFDGPGGRRGHRRRPQPDGG